MDGSRRERQDWDEDGQHDSKIQYNTVQYSAIYKNSGSQSIRTAGLKSSLRTLVSLLYQGF